MDDFRPRWASAPGESIQTALLERDWDLSRFAAEVHLDENAAAGLLDGSADMTVAVARELAQALGGSSRFWLSREARYRESLEWVHADRWVSLLPANEMASLGWIDAPKDWFGRIAAFMDFFGVESPLQMTAEHTQIADAKFRSTPTEPKHEATVAAWVRQVELESEVVTCSPWDRNAFAAVLPQAAALSRQADPRDFLPSLKQLAASTGVVVVVVRAPTGCPVSGVSITLESGRRVIGLSARYRSDDHFWFTFLHEAAHIVLHEGVGMYIDDIERDGSPGSEGPEAEADQFASEMLLPSELLEKLPNRITPVTIHGLANRASVSPGVVLGQLQHAGLVSYRSKMNRLKHRYSWDGPVLSRQSA